MALLQVIKNVSLGLFTVPHKCGNCTSKLKLIMDVHILGKAQATYDPCMLEGKFPLVKDFIRKFSMRNSLRQPLDDISCTENTMSPKSDVNVALKFYYVGLFKYMVMLSLSNTILLVGMNTCPLMNYA